MANDRQTNDLLMLTDAHEEIRKLLAGETINKLMMERKYFDLCLKMATIARLAHTCNGIYFGLHIKAGAPVDKVVSNVTDKNHLTSIEEAENMIRVDNESRL